MNIPGVVRDKAEDEIEEKHYIRRGPRYNKTVGRIYV